MRIVETGAGQCRCGSTQVVLTEHVKPFCNGCGATWTGTTSEIRVGSDVYRKRADGSWPLEPERAVVVQGTPQIVDMPSLDCPSCKRPRRERGEVRTHVWKCGCPVRPEGVSRLPKEAMAGNYDEEVWCADGIVHPTREGAIADWRTALADEQRREDERAEHPPVRVDFVEVIQGALTDDQVDAMSRSLFGIDYASGPDRTGFVTQQDVGRGITEALERAADRRRNKTTATMPAAQSAELVRATVPAIDIDALSLEGLCELATELAKRHPERMREWRTAHPFSTEVQLRDLVRHLSGESVSDPAFARSLAEVKR